MFWTSVYRYNRLFEGNHNADAKCNEIEFDTYGLEKTHTTPLDATAPPQVRSLWASQCTSMLPSSIKHIIQLFLELITYFSC